MARTLRIALSATVYELPADGEAWAHVEGPRLDDLLPDVPTFAEDPAALIAAQPSRVYPWVIIRQPAYRDLPDRSEPRVLG